MMITFPVWGIEATGYTPISTFWQDFCIAERYGLQAVKETYRRAFRCWKSNAEYLTELALVLNWKIWQHYEEKRDDFATLYDRLWKECDAWCMDNGG